MITQKGTFCETLLGWILRICVLFCMYFYFKKKINDSIQIKSSKFYLLELWGLRDLRCKAPVFGRQAAFISYFPALISSLGESLNMEMTKLGEERKISSLPPPPREQKSTRKNMQRCGVHVSLFHLLSRSLNLSEAQLPNCPKGELPRLNGVIRKGPVPTLPVCTPELSES